MTEPLIITTLRRDDHQLDLTIELGPERTEQAIQRAARLVSKKARIPGFRPGKAPITTVLRMYGKDAVLSEILDDLGQEVYKEALESEKLDPYSQAGLEDVTFSPLKFKLVVPLRPTVSLGDYGALRVEAPVATASDADVDAVLEQARQAHQEIQTVDRLAAIGDSVLVDIKGTVGESSIMDNQDWELTLRGEGGWLPGFDEAFVGLQAGDDKTFELTYPEDSASRYKGQLAVFNVHVKAVKAKALPEVTDEFVKSLGDYADVTDYRTKKLAEIQKQRDAEALAKLNDDAVEALVAQATIAYPPAAVDDVVVEMVRDMEMRLSNIGYSLQDSLRLQGKTLEAYRKELRPVAEKRVKGRLALSELAAREGITISAEEKQAELERLVAEAKDAESGLAIREVFGSDNGLHMIEHDLLTEKTLARLRGIATGQIAAIVTPAVDAPVIEAAAEGSDVPVAPVIEAAAEGSDAPDAPVIEVAAEGSDAPVIEVAAEGSDVPVAPVIEVAAEGSDAPVADAAASPAQGEADAK